MALNKNATTPRFEDESEDTSNDTAGVETGTAGADVTRTLTADERVAAASAKKAAATAKEEVAEKVAPAAKAESASREVAAAPAGGGKLATQMKAADPFADMENAIKVDYNTLTRIMVTNGNVQNKDTKQLMGPEAVIELISLQKHWTMSPGGESKDKESLEFLKFSDDGVHVRGESQTLVEARDVAIAAGYKKASINERLILVGMMVDAGKLAETMNGEMVQMDLAPRSMANFNRHRISTTFRIAKGLQPAAGAEVVKIGCDVKSENGNNWTDATFTSVK